MNCSQAATRFYLKNSAAIFAWDIEPDGVKDPGGATSRGAGKEPHIVPETHFPETLTDYHCRLTAKPLKAEPETENFRLCPQILTERASISFLSSLSTI